MADYLYTASADQVAVASGARHTVLQLATPSGTQITIASLEITFDGTNASNTPVLVTLERQASAGTGGVSLTSGWGPNPLDPNLPSTSVTALKGAWATTEPALTTVYYSWRIPPTGGLVRPFPLDEEPVCPGSAWIALVVNAGSAVNATATLTWRQ